MPERRKLYVAEIGENGAIECVWVHAPGGKGSRPFDPATERFDLTGPADFFGAKPEAIRSWLSFRHGSRSAGATVDRPPLRGPV